MTTDMLNEKKFRDIYTGFLESGLTVRDYCANQQMNEAKFYYWQNKLKGHLPPKRGFVPVLFVEGHGTRQPHVKGTVQRGATSFTAPAVSNKTISCEINYPNGVSIKLNGLPDTQMLKSLLVLTRR
jgi:hypothetical protein